MRVVIIGGVAAGASAAARLRRLREDIEIVIYEKTGFISYANCGLPYFVGDVIKEKKDLLVQDANAFSKRFNVEVKVNHEVLSIDKEKKRLIIKNLTDGTEFTDYYDKLLIATGAKAVVPPFAKDKKGVYILKTVEDAVRLKTALKEKDVKRVLVVGTGFIGIETAENLSELGVDVTMLELAEQVLPQLDGDMSQIVKKELERNGIKLILGSALEDIKETNDGLIAIYSGGKTIDADIIVLSIGVSPESSLIPSSGIKGSIPVNSSMYYADDIYAAGDVAEITNEITGEKALISLAGPANKEARVAADNIAGLNSVYNGSLASSVIKVFGLTVGFTGLNEKTAAKSGIKYSKIYLSPANHATYYPGSAILDMKIIYSEDDYRLLGASIIGKDGVDKRIDVLATAIHFKASVIDLKDLDLSYAPPYSSAKDPVNMAGFIGENIKEGRLKQYYAEDIPEINLADSIFLDVREKIEFEAGHIEGAINIPLSSIRSSLSLLDKRKKIYVNCQSGLRSYIACRILSQNGFDVYNLSGGYRHYSYSQKSKNTLCGAEI